MSDMISRQSAIDALRKKQDNGKGDISRFYNTIIQHDIEAIMALPSSLSTNLAEVGTDAISRQAAIDICDNVIDLFRGQFGAGVLVAVKESIEELPSAQPEIIRCKDCKYWVPGYITDNDDFIPPKCGEWQQMVGHSSDDYCSLAERREVTT